MRTNRRQPRVAWSLAARAQQSTIPIIGFLGIASAEGYRDAVAAFREGLQDSAYVEGRNVAIEYRWAELISYRRWRPVWFAVRCP